MVDPIEVVNRVILRKVNSLALKSNGSMVGWGFDLWGQATPPIGNDYIAIAAGYAHCLALKSDGSVVGWGYNAYGQATPPSPAEVIELYSYDVFGLPTIRDANGVILTSSGFGNRFMFTGREYDAETGLYYYRARFYNPHIGRFMQTDPIGYAGGLNLYTYCGNNPLNWADPYGLDRFRPCWAGPLSGVGEAAGRAYDALGGRRGEVYLGGASRALGGVALMGGAAVYMYGTTGLGAAAGGLTAYGVGWSQWASGLDMMRDAYRTNYEDYLNRPEENALRGILDVGGGILIKDPLSTIQGVEEIALSLPKIGENGEKANTECPTKNSGSE